MTLARRSSLPSTEVITLDDMPITERTVRMYRREQRAWERWASERGEPLFPARVRAIADYLTWLHDAKGFKLKTLERVRAALSVSHRIAASLVAQRGGDPPPNPVADYFVTTAIAKLRMKHRKSRAVPREPIRYDQLVRIVAAQPATLEGIRARALCAAMWFGMLRGSEAAGLELVDLHFEPNGIEVTIHDAKTAKDGKPQVAALYRRDDLEVCAVRELLAWLDAAGVESGRLFRRFHRNRHDRSITVGESLSYAGVRTAVVEALRVAKVRSPEKYGTHSFRAGAATELSKDGASAIELMQAGRWQSPDIAAGYVRGSPLVDSPFAKLFRRRLDSEPERIDSLEAADQGVDPTFVS